MAQDEADRASDAPSVLASIDHRAHGLRDGLEGLRDMMDRLIEGCPWDKAQTLDSLRPYLIEEAYEVLDAMNDPAAHRVELGDLLFQVVFQSALREREGHFDLDGVVEAIRSKMIRRHPHVFGDDEVTSADEVRQRWSEIKARERGESAQAPPNPLAGVPKSMPALERAWRLQDRAASVGFDWPDVAGPLAKLKEELAELEAAVESGERNAIEAELGDLLFVAVRLGQKLQIEPESALRSTIAKFERRFGHVMQRCHDHGIEPAQAGLERLDEFWNEAKRAGL